ncbi:hypothetical protein [Flavobacterium quisquiliarum]|jgi:hypothetical protein|uniref:Outer membrane protein beta-barrel domain-containing protein n=1 Tax=Flavobacterium quisquiliarum TaxID=1834436 RepID=A0ABV8WBT9_9FLAO|nr:hypothetical protein [Flavobacterium quisquiliarum]MBW1658306.1 hypothetical protein [Flavobacterium quisquiliarum]NWL02165.1 hypothetical protein [Flavobacterium collinsii]
MKAIIALIVFLISLLTTHISQAQTINWESLEKNQKHILNLNAGWDYSFVYGLSYGYHLKTELPIILESSISLASGEVIFDDFKTKIGGQIHVYQIKNFRFNASLHGIYRRYENPLVTLQNFGVDAGVVIGYYEPKWFASGEFGFDKAIVTHFKHSDIYKDVYPDVKNGWYEPSTGGNFNFGVQGGYSFDRSDITLRAGKVMTQDFKTTPLIPFYVQLGYNYKLD